MPKFYLFHLPSCCLCNNFPTIYAFLKQKCLRIQIINTRALNIILIFSQKNIHTFSDSLRISTLKIYNLYRCCTKMNLLVVFVMLLCLPGLENWELYMQFCCRSLLTKKHIVESNKYKKICLKKKKRNAFV